MDRQAVRAAFLDALRWEGWCPPEAAGHLRACAVDWSTFEAPSDAVTTAGSEALDELRAERL